MNTITSQAYLKGFKNAKRGKIFATRRNVEKAFPEFSPSESACYLNGEDDGIRNDTFRSDLITADWMRQNL